MILLGDCLTVLGARHGLALRPQERCASLVRCARHTENKFQLEVGLRIGGREYYAPFCVKSETHPFDFADERMGIADTEFDFIAAEHGVMVTLKMYIPFRPKDEAYSTVPVLYMSVKVRNLRGNYRWTERKSEKAAGEVFVAFDDKIFVSERGENILKLSYDLRAERKADFYAAAEGTSSRQTDEIDVLRGGFGGRANELSGVFSLDAGQESEPILFAWCSCLPDVFQYRGEKCPFAYRDRFSDLRAVSSYAREHAEEVRKNAQNLNAIFLGSDLGTNFDKLLCMSLHSYLMNTWLVKKGERKIFTVWEGNCYFNSTVDVEYTEEPFYLMLFPGLLKYQLDMWPEFAKRNNEGTYLCHDIGELTEAEVQHYPHDMPIEESADYILMLYMYEKATGDEGTVSRNRVFAEELLRFIRRCGGESGLAHLHTANTLDDAGSAMQYGKEQVYLGMKTAYAYLCGAELVSDPAERKAYRKLSRRIVREIEKRGFGDGHYFVALSDDHEGVSDTWSNRPLEGRIPGVKASHIYTFNTYALTSYAGLGPLLSSKRAKADLDVSLRETLQTYGSRHTSYLSEMTADMAAGLAGNSPKCGWISLNVARDIAAMRQGKDYRNNFQRYWDWVETANSGEFMMFMETFCGNNLHYYPRGVVLFGVFSAARGVRVRDGRVTYDKKRQGDYPVIELADYASGHVPGRNKERKE